MISVAANTWGALCYHDVQAEMPRAGGGPDHFTVPVTSFAGMLDTIAEHGFTGCSLARALAEPGRRRIAITFDDGTRGQYDYAFPELVARGMTATFYVTTNWVGQPGYMTWSQLRELTAAGMSVQSHTRSHPFLSELGSDELRSELAGSKRELDSQLGQDTSEIAFPGGDAPRSRFRHILGEAGYRIAVGTRWGLNTDTRHADPGHNFIRRCTVRGVLTPAMAERVVRADPWLAMRWTAKEATLRRFRTSIGASRYARWRRFVLDTFN
jgi:peptidoglycan/xylan/chitin deacetylase (PgdA/CDA1 family)